MSVVQIEALPAHLASQLAPEIFDMILDNFHQSKQDLSTCSVVCKAWLPVCRYHLFAAVSYHAEFAHLLASSTHASLTISPYIRTITLKGPLAQHKENNLLIDSILSLPSVTSLQIERIVWIRVCMKLPSSFTLALSGSSATLALLSLNLRQVNFPSCSALADFLGLFTSLQNLTLENVSWDGVGSKSGERVPFLSSSSLKILRVIFSNNRIILNWLHHGIVSDAILERETACHRSFPHLKMLSFSDILPREADIMGAFLDSLGDSLEHLEAGILIQDLDGRNNDALSQSLGFSRNVSLKTIIIHRITLFQFPSLVTPVATAFHSIAQPSMLSSPYAWLPTIISSVRSEEIHTIEFHIWFSSEPQLDQMPWAALCNVLTNLGITTLVFHVFGIGADMQLVRGWFMKRLAPIDLTKTTIEFDFSE
ncbi:hypothetical protein M413DRAFT_409612 [Hebeloma cylindrosporum]|uniref:F-box domain-containing protein n=1 Tax=Hebeloma cylindrosporum TaxID=76867 RepID=A0A0C3CFD7_HEBCY|nr:hypothetical protein M413DRAFT_409612 [Hebeloma cylindrosporum h7]